MKAKSLGMLLGPPEGRGAPRSSRLRCLYISPYVVLLLFGLLQRCLLFCLFPATYGAMCAVLSSSNNSSSSSFRCMYTSQPGAPPKAAAAAASAPLSWLVPSAAARSVWLPRNTLLSRPGNAATAATAAAATATAATTTAAAAAAGSVSIGAADWADLEVSPEVTFTFTGDLEGPQLLLATQYHLEQNQKQQLQQQQQQQELLLLQQQRHPQKQEQQQENLPRKQQHNEAVIVHRRLQPLHKQPQQQQQRQAAADLLEDFDVSSLPLETRADRREQRAARRRRNMGSADPQAGRPTSGSSRSSSSTSSSSSGPSSSGLDDLLQLLGKPPTRLQRQQRGKGDAAAERVLEAYGPLSSEIPFLTEEEETSTATAAATAATGEKTQEEDDVSPFVNAAELAETVAEIEAITGDSLELIPKEPPQQQQQQQQQQQNEVKEQEDVAFGSPFGSELEVLGSMCSWERGPAKGPPLKGPPKPPPKGRGPPRAQRPHNRSSPSGGGDAKGDTQGAKGDT